ncbi:hypothetical protein L6R53_27105 [Myxococcota bacterium]|nr:hypothetical protein [Myxococcota bacterium]
MTAPPALSLSLPAACLVPRMGLRTGARPLPPVQVEAGRVRLLQYADGVELVVQTAAPPWPLAAALATLALSGSCLAALGQLGALALAAVGLGGLAWLAARPPTVRRLLAHGATETWLLSGRLPGRALSGGASADLVLALDRGPRGRVHLRLFAASGELDMGRAPALEARELALVRRFLALSGLKATGAALAR